MNTKIAIFLVVAWWKLESHFLCTTTLCVLDSSTISLARSCVLALGSIRHGKDQVQIDIKCHRDIEISDGEFVFTRRDLWSTTAGLVQSTLDTFRLEMHQIRLFKEC